MKSYTAFIFDSYALKPDLGQIELTYALDDNIHFRETLTLPSTLATTLANTIHRKDIQSILFALHLIGGVSYFKTYCPKTIEIHSGTLSTDQAQFWNTVYENGLGEFFFSNKVDFRGLIDFPHADTALDHAQERMIKTFSSVHRDTRKSKPILVPMGGGKDSLVVLEELSQSGLDSVLFRLERTADAHHTPCAHPVIENSAKIADRPLITVSRTLSPKLYELNDQGALNGHVPITAYVSVVSTLVALLSDIDSIAIPCEKSSNEGNVEYLGKTINHQWSKSEEFEHLYQDYLSRFISPSLFFFSPIRTLRDLEIAEMFSRHQKYFHAFTSCNQNWKKGNQNNSLWCGSCPKCAYTFLLLSAYLPKETMVSIFGKNLFNEDSLLATYMELLGLEGNKPFDCVGTVEETKEAFKKVHTKAEWNDTKAVQLFLNEMSFAPAL